VGAYLAVLRIADYRRLSAGLMLNLLGDGASFVALAWIAADLGGASALSALGIAYTLPVILGGVVVGPLLDRFSRRRILVVDSVFRALVVAAVPALHAVGALADWHIYVVAAVYGLLKIIPLGAVPTVVPELVPAERLQAASALEAIAVGVGGIAGPAIGAVLIAVVGVHNVLWLDAATYLVFALLILRIRAPLGRPQRVEGPVRDRGGWVPVLRLVMRDRFLLFIILSFTAFNVSAGVLLVALPWLVRFEFAAGPGILGLLLAATACAELIGALISGGIKTSDRQMLRIGLLQFGAGAAYLLLFSPHLSLLLAGLVISGVLAGPMTVLSGVVRMTRIPDRLRGRTMTLSRTMMTGAMPLGSALAGALLAADLYGLLIVAIALLAAAPGLLMAATFRTASFRQGLLDQDVAGSAPATAQQAAA
jgi:MFS family permease